MKIIQGAEKVDWEAIRQMEGEERLEYVNHEAHYPAMFQ